MAPVESAPRSDAAALPRVLVVDDEPMLVELIGDLVSKGVRCQVISAHSVAEARRIIAAEPVQLLVTDVHLADGNGMSLLPSLKRQQTGAGAIVVTGSASVDTAIRAIRCGAVDFVAKPFSNDQFIERVRNALDQQARFVRHSKRIDRLRVAVRRLNEARKVIGKKVDLLCNDLISAYGELSRQVDGVRTQEGFRKYIADAKDLEQLLCHSMDWLLRQMGYSNVAVWLASEENEFQLGAYMKYTVPGEPVLTGAIKRVILPLTAHEGIVRTTGDAIAKDLTPQELHYLKGQDILSVNCTYLGEALAAVVFFRDERGGFTEQDHALLQSVSPLLAVALATMVHEPGGEEGEEPFLESGGTADPTEKRKEDPADWWKKGDAPPF